MADEPWPIANALEALKEMRSGADRTLSKQASERTTPDPVRDAYQDGVDKAMDYAIEVVKGINEVRPPTPPTEEQIAAKAFRTLRHSLADAFREFADALEDDDPRYRDYND
jgi:hypothetical protein